MQRLKRSQKARDDETAKDLLSAYGAYEEEGECEYLVEEEIPLNVARRLLQPAMRDILDTLRNNRGLCVSEIAYLLQRSVSNVYTDLKFLASYNVVYLEKLRKRVVPHALIEELRVVP